MAVQLRLCGGARTSCQRTQSRGRTGLSGGLSSPISPTQHAVEAIESDNEFAGAITDTEQRSTADSSPARNDPLPAYPPRGAAHRRRRLNQSRPRSAISLRRRRAPPYPVRLFLPVRAAPSAPRSRSDSVGWRRPEPSAASSIFKLCRSSSARSARRRRTAAIPATTRPTSSKRAPPNASGRQFHPEPLGANRDPAVGLTGSQPTPGSSTSIHSMRIGAAEQPAAVLLLLPRRITGDDAGRHTGRLKQDGGRGCELLTKARVRTEQEIVDGVLTSAHLGVQLVRLVAVQVGHHRVHRLLTGRGACGQLPAQREDPCGNPGRDNVFFVLRRRRLGYLAELCSADVRDDAGYLVPPPATVDGNGGSVTAESPVTSCVAVPGVSKGSRSDPIGFT